MRVDNMCHPVTTLVMVTLLACAAALPASDEKVNGKHNIARSINKFHAQRQTEALPPVTRRSVRYCHFQTPCAWRIYTYSDFAEISLTNNYCVCRTSQKCLLYERHISEGYSEFRCMRS